MLLRINDHDAILYDIPSTKTKEYTKLIEQATVVLSPIIDSSNNNEKIQDKDNNVSKSNIISISTMDTTDNVTSKLEFMLKKLHK